MKSSKFDDDMFNPNVTITLQEPRSRAIWLCLGALAFVVSGIWLIMRGDAEGLIGWASTGFFGLCLLVGLAMLFGPRATLTLTPDGFEYVNLGRSDAGKWSQYARFGTTRIGLTAMVGMDFTDEMLASLPPVFAKASAFTKGTSGFHGALPSTYGVKARDLSQAMETRRLAALSNQRG